MSETQTRYRFLGQNEVIREGDEFAFDNGRGHYWVKCVVSVGKRAGLLSTFPNDVRREVR